MITCRFCNLSIDEGKLSAHYRKLHKATDFILSRKIVLCRTERKPEQKINTRKKTKECIMCLEHHDTLLLPCNHDSSCSNCLMRWWKESYHSPRCPMCRTDVQNIMEGDTEKQNILKMWYNWRERKLNQGTNRRVNRIPSFIY